MKKIALKGSLARSHYKARTPHNKEIISPFWILKGSIVCSWQLTVEHFSQKLKVWWHILAMSCPV
jgi:hypothetical protein